LQTGTNQEPVLINKRLKTPRAAAIAGIVFSTLTAGYQLLIWNSIPADPLAPASELVKNSKTLSLAFNLVPFAGIAFLWFIAVVRDHLGKLEDRFFATVFFGSGVLYVAMLFTSAALAGGLLQALGSKTETLIHSDAYALARTEIYQLTTIYATKMAAMFMMTTSTISKHTQIVSRWMVFLGYGLAVLLLLSAGSIPWSPVVFPVWVFFISVEILIAKLRNESAKQASIS
jgi:hypothetical protein